MSEKDGQEMFISGSFPLPPAPAIGKAPYLRTVHPADCACLPPPLALR